MTKIAVVGTCHVVGIADALLNLSDKVTVVALVPGAVKAHNGESGLEAAAQLLKDSDFIISQYTPDEFGPLSTLGLKANFSNVIDVPVITFSGFHPDCIYMDWQHINYNSMLGPYNSAIVAAAFGIGVPVDRVHSLFNSFVFRTLGYYDEFSKGRAYLESYGAHFGMDIGDEWPLWMAKGSFMLTINHPKPVVLASVAKFAAVKAGMIAKETSVPEVYFDQLVMEPIWPVYPELAQTLGVSGGYVFKKYGFSNTANGQTVLLNLKDFIAGSYQAYGSYPREVFDNERVARVRAIISPIIS